MNRPMTFPNPAQRAIIDHLHGALLVTAPAGTGKTRVLAARIVNAVQRSIADPSRVLCLTFTNRAAEEMRKALRETGATWAREVAVRTFHGLCAYLLRAEAREIGLPADFVIYDDEDAQELIREVFDIKRASADQKTRNQLTQKLYSALTDARQDASADLLSLRFPGGLVAERVFARLESPERIAQAIRYQRALAERHALDYGDLVYFARAMLAERPDILDRWSRRFDLIQVDEMQDTHPAEYEIARMLARRSGNLAMIGDLAQTIYGWRGSKPAEVLAAFARDFAPARFTLRENYRATRALLQAADSFARGCNSLHGRYTPLVPAPECEPGEAVQIASREDEETEARWIGRKLTELGNGRLGAGPDGGRQTGALRFGRTAILTRTNTRAVTIHDEIARQFGRAIPMVTIEAFEFFRRAEIKEALAYLRLLTHPHDTGAMRRIKVLGLGETALKTLLAECEPVGLRLSDFARADVLRDGDPFQPLLAAWREDDVVVFDTETTGLDPATDEIVEIAAQRLHRGRPVAAFHRFIRVADVGASVRVHGLSNTDLAIRGESAGAVLGDFLNFARGAHLVGHNVYFDLKMLAAHARRIGLDVPKLEATDTWDTARRFVPSENYRLETLAATLGLPHPPTHRADADVRTTVALLGRLIALVQEQTLQRVAVTGRYARMFGPLAARMADWREAAPALRPVELLRRVLNETRLIQGYPEAERGRRSETLRRLVSIFADKDDPTLHPDTALRALLDYAAMARNADQLAQAEDRVMVCTVHQAKGLEFDHVFIAGAVEGEFPSFLSTQDGDPARLEEEQRLFYVAMTRARKRLFITRHAVNRYNYRRPPSPYLGLIDRAVREEV